MDVDAGDQFLHVERLANEIDSPELEALDDGILIGEGADQDHRERPIRLFPGLQHLNAEKSGEPVVNQNKVEILLQPELESFVSVVCDGDCTADRLDRKSTRLNSSHTDISRMPSSA